VNIHDNTVKGGAVKVLEHQVVGGSIFAPGDGRVTFDFNNYEATTFSFNGQANWSQWQSAGNDVNGTWTP
jgi:hypothetical protein